jgi:O-antigen/teichoic acid export membrane protein
MARYLIGPLKSVAYAELARLWGLGHRHAFLQRARSFALWIGVPLGISVLAGVGFMPFALPLLVGAAYFPAVRAAQLLFIGAGISLAFFWLRPIYLARGHSRQLFIVNSSVTLVFALVYPFVIREWGFVGASTWMLALSVVGSGCAALWLWKQAK